MALTGWPSGSKRTRSSSAAAAPWVTPPRTCPSTTIGLMTTPQSSTTRYRCSRIAQVPGSITTMAAWQALEKVPGGSNVARASSP